MRADRESRGELVELFAEAATDADPVVWRDFEEVDSDARAKKNVVAAIEQGAKRLGNTRAVCRKCYVHPAVIDAYMDGTMMKTIAQRAQRTAKAVGKMTAAEAAVLGLLQRRMSKSIGRTA